MIKKTIIYIFFLFFSMSLYAEYEMERVICTTKKSSNCGAYIYNTKTGEVYFCDSEKCKQLDTPIEIFIEEEIEEDKKSKVPKLPKKESKVPKLPKKESKIPKLPEKKD